MSKVLSFVSIKGGVGKSTLAIETAAALANNFNKKVLLVDANFSAPNVDLYLDLTSEVTLHDALLGVGLHNAIYEAHGFDVVLASQNYDEEIDVFRLKKVLEKMKDRYDYIILDSSPHHSELLPVIIASDNVFIVTTPDHVTLTTSLKAAVLANKNNTVISGIIINRVRSPRHEESLKDVEKLMGMPVLAKIKEDKKILRAVNNRTPLILYNCKSSAAKELIRFSAFLAEENEKEPGFFEKKLFFSKELPKERINRDLARQGFYEGQL